MERRPLASMCMDSGPCSQFQPLVSMGWTGPEHPNDLFSPSNQESGSSGLALPWEGIAL